MVARGMYPERGAATAEPTAADCLFAQLDQRRIDGSKGALINVVGIHESPGDGMWVQIALADEPADGLVLHLPTRATIQQAIAALNAWGTTRPDRRPRLVRVMQLA